MSLKPTTAPQCGTHPPCDDATTHKSPPPPGPIGKNEPVVLTKVSAFFWRRTAPELPAPCAVISIRYTAAERLSTNRTLALTSRHTLTRLFTLSCHEGAARAPALPRLYTRHPRSRAREGASQNVQSTHAPRQVTSVSRPHAGSAPPPLVWGPRHWLAGNATAARRAAAS
jgi:hypothetical protein